MANITVPRDAQFTPGVKEHNDPVAADTKLIKGGMYGLLAGVAVKMESGVAATARGEVLATVDNTDGDAGDKNVEGRSGCFRLHILGSSPVVKADIGAIVYFQDDQTVAKSSNGGARPIAGRLIDVRAGMAEVQIGPSSIVASPDGDLVAANNLSDVVSPSAAAQNIGALEVLENLGDLDDAGDARDNLGLGDDATGRGNLGIHGTLMCFLPSLLAGTYYFPIPDVAATLTKLKVSINQALGGADLVATCSINATPITTGAVTVTQAGSAAGDQGEASPTAANVSDGANDLLKVVLSGNTTAGTGALLVEYTY